MAVLSCRIVGIYARKVTRLTEPPDERQRDPRNLITKITLTPGAKCDEVNAVSPAKSAPAGKGLLCPARFQCAPASSLGKVAQGR